MKYFKDFDWKIMINRVLVITITTFLSAFSKQYLETHDIQLAINAGLAVLVQSAFSAIGLDQLIFQFFKQPDVKNVVQALRVSSNKES